MAWEAFNWRPAVSVCLSVFPLAAQYSVHVAGDVVRLEDAGRQTVVSVMPSRGNNPFRITVVKGKDVIRFPLASADEFKRPGRPERWAVPRAVGKPLGRHRQQQVVKEVIGVTRDGWRQCEVAPIFV